MGVVVVDHPYYPTDLQINNYVPNTRSTLRLLVIAGGIMTSLITLCLISTRKSTTSNSRFTWFAICGAMHTMFEGYWLLHRSTIASQTDLFAELWKEYAHGDSRYLAADELLLTLELMTAV
jgi:cholestenol delta-isomerase